MHAKSGYFSWPTLYIMYKTKNINCYNNCVISHLIGTGGELTDVITHIIPQGDYQTGKVKC